MFQLLARRLAHARYNRVLSMAMIRPQDDPRAGAGHPEALRVLLLGSGVASGQGVSTYGLALVGALQRVLQSRLARPVEVELIRQHGAGVGHAAGLARTRAGEEWDAYVLAFGVNDALRLTPVAAWRRGLALLLATIEDVKRSPLQVPVLVAGIPPLQSFPAHEGLLLPLLQRHAARLNEATRRLLLLHDAAFFVPLQGCRADGGRPYGYPEAYQTWAETLADQLVPLLAPVPRRLAAPQDGEPAGSRTRELLKPRHAEQRAHLQDVALRARTLLGGDYAMVRLVEGDHLLVVADSLGSTPRTLPLAGSMAALALELGSLHVADCARDSRLARLRQPALFGLRSYHEEVLRDADGDAVGTLCVLGGAVDDAAAAGALARLATEAGSRLDAFVPGAGARVAIPGPVVDPPRREEALIADLDPSRGEGWWHRALTAARTPVRWETEGPRLIQGPKEQAVPADRHLRVPGPAPIRLLVLGGEYATGYGVETRSEALDGALARLLHRRTGRGVVVLNRADDRAPMRRLAEHAAVAGEEAVDLVVWTPIFTHAVRAPRRSTWTRSIARLLADIRATSDAGIVLMGFPLLTGHQPLAVLGRARARRINQLLAEAAAGFRGVRVAEPGTVALHGIESVDGAATYRLAATHMFEHVMDVLHHASVVHEQPVAG